MKIGILSRNAHLYSTHSLYRAARHLKLDVEIIDHTRCNLVIEQNQPKIYFENRELSYLEAVVPRIGASVTAYGAAVIEQFENLSIFTSVRTRALLQSRDKLRSLQMLSRAGLDLPKSFIVYKTEELEPMLDLLPKGPVIIKLLEGTHGAGVVIAESRRSAVSMIEAFTKLGKQVLVQEFIEESDGTDIRAIVVGGKVIAAMKRKAATGEFRSNLHRGASSEPYTLNAEEVHIVTTAARTMGLEVAGIDLLPSNRGKLVMEVNASPGLEGIETTTRINVGWYIMDYVVKRAEKIAQYKKKQKM